MKTLKQKRILKYEKVYVIQCYYGFGWEDLTEEVKYSEAKLRAKEYRENDDHPIRMIARNEIRQEWKDAQLNLSTPATI